jgi:hypothetical protein
MYHSHLKARAHLTSESLQEFAVTIEQLAHVPLLGYTSTPSTVRKLMHFSIEEGLRGEVPIPVSGVRMPDKAPRLALKLEAGQQPSH